MRCLGYAVLTERWPWCPHIRVVEDMSEHAYAALYPTPVRNMHLLESDRKTRAFQTNQSGGGFRKVLLL
jgi:hypothetical protein